MTAFERKIEDWVAQWSKVTAGCVAGGSAGGRRRFRGQKMSAKTRRERHRKNMAKYRQADPEHYRQQNIKHVRAFRERRKQQAQAHATLQ